MQWGERENRKAEIQDKREKRKSESKKGAGEIRSCRLLCVSLHFVCPCTILSA